MSDTTAPVTPPPTPSASSGGLPRLGAYELRRLAEAAAGIAKQGTTRMITIANGKWTFTDEAVTSEAPGPSLEIGGLDDAYVWPALPEGEALAFLDRADAEARRAEQADEVAKHPSNPPAPDFFDCRLYDAFFWSWPAVEKFVLPYYLRLREPDGIVEMERKVKQPDVIGVLHGDMSPETMVSGKVANYFSVKRVASARLHGGPDYLIEPL